MNGGGQSKHRIKNESGYSNQVGLLRRRCQLATILGSTFSPADKAPPSTPRKIVTHKNHRWDFSPLSTGRPNRLNTDRLQINRGVLGAVEPGWAVVRRLAAPGGPSMVPRVMPCAAVLPSASADALIAECGGGQPKVYRMDNTLLRADFLGLVPGARSRCHRIHPRRPGDMRPCGVPASSAMTRATGGSAWPPHTRASTCPRTWGTS